MKRRGRFVQIPLDRPRSRAEMIDRFEANTAPSWKSYEALYGEEHNFLGKDADRVVREKNPKLIRRADDLGMIRTEIGGVGDAKEHTYPNGIYQTGTSWYNLDSREAKRSDAAIIEFIREPPVPDGDTLINTPEFDILGIIVYDEA